jgi:biopolymer transport protein ExbD
VKLARRPARRARIEIVPMIDTVFFLLVFFMMATLSMAVYRGLPVNLPTAASGQQELRENASITVTKQGQIHLNEQPVSLEDVAAHLKALLAGHPNLAVIINADAEVTHGRVVTVLDEARSAGVNRLAIAIVPKREVRP